jgi:tight adherence protein B
MFLILFIINLYLCFQKKPAIKNNFLFFLQPILYFLGLILIFYFAKLKEKFTDTLEDRKITREIPTLIDFLRSYLLAGMILPNALSLVLKQKKWCKPIMSCLSEICHEHAKGTRFQECLSHGIDFAKQTNSRQYLCLLFLSLRAGISCGENIGSILEKVKTKTQDRLELNRKLKLITAQMRLQSLVILLAPMGLGIIIQLISPNYLHFFFTSKCGHFLFAIMIILNLLGAYFLKKILTIKG